MKTRHTGLLAGNDKVAEIPFTVLENVSRKQLSDACHEAAFRHFGKEGEGDIHLLGIRLAGTDGINKTFILKAELRTKHE